MKFEYHISKTLYSGDYGDGEIVFRSSNVNKAIDEYNSIIKSLDEDMRSTIINEGFTGRDLHRKRHAIEYRLYSTEVNECGGEIGEDTEIDAEYRDYADVYDTMQIELDLRYEEENRREGIE